MYIGFYSYTKQFNNNKLLEDPNSPLGDNLIYPFVLLGQKLTQLGHKVATTDTDDILTFDAVIFIEFPGFNNPYFKKLIANGQKNLYLILLESPIIKPDNYLLENHKYFKKVFTWADSLIDNKTYFKINYSHNIPKEINFDLSKKGKLCALISSNKSMDHPQELYSKRIEAIRWFEKNHPNDFDLFGFGWGHYNFYGAFGKFKFGWLNRLTLLTKLLSPRFASYKGTVSSKQKTYQKYKFSICYENTTNDGGYITEKIFDCFLAGCVPIYWGASNITQHIPQNTFIDKKQFDSYEKLYDYIKNMPDQEYLGYLENIKNFLQSAKAHPFSADYFANTIIKEILS